MKALGFLNIVLAGLNAGLFIGNGGIPNLIVAVLCGFGAWLILSSESRAHRVDIYRQRMTELDTRINQMRRNPRFISDPLYYELQIENSQMTMMWLRALYYDQSRVHRFISRLLRCEFPTKDYYAQSRRFWLENVQAWRGLKTM